MISFVCAEYQIFTALVLLSTLLLTQAKMSLHFRGTWAHAGSWWFSWLLTNTPSPFLPSSFLDILPQTSSGAGNCFQPRAGPQCGASYNCCRAINPACPDSSVETSCYQDPHGVRFLFWFSKLRDNAFQKINGKKILPFQRMI